MLINYNLTLWLCMKMKFVMLKLLLSGPNQLGNDTDVFLELLIDDLNFLLNNIIEVIDAYHKEKFILKAIIMWPINDFLAYGNLLCHEMKHYFTCPICSRNTYVDRLYDSHKMCYKGHRRILPLGPCI